MMCPFCQEPVAVGSTCKPCFGDWEEERAAFHATHADLLGRIAEQDLARKERMARESRWNALMKELGFSELEQPRPLFRTMRVSEAPGWRMMPCWRYQRSTKAYIAAVKAKRAASRAAA